MRTLLGYNPKYAEEPFVDFHKVNTDTDVKKLNLNWKEKDLPEKVRTKHVHRLHPYLGKFIPQLVEIFLRKIDPLCVCDPFVGSGTEPVARFYAEAPSQKALKNLVEEGRRFIYS